MLGVGVISAPSRYALRRRRWGRPGNQAMPPCSRCKGQWGSTRSGPGSTRPGLRWSGVRWPPALRPIVRSPCQLLLVFGLALYAPPLQPGGAAPVAVERLGPLDLSAAATLAPGGPGSLDQLPDLPTSLGCGRVAVVTDPLPRRDAVLGPLLAHFGPGQQSVAPPAGGHSLAPVPGGVHRQTQLFSEWPQLPNQPSVGHPVFAGELVQAERELDIGRVIGEQRPGLGQGLGQPGLGLGHRSDHPRPAHDLAHPLPAQAELPADLGQGGPALDCFDDLAISGLVAPIQGTLRGKPPVALSLALRAFRAARCRPARPRASQAPAVSAPAASVTSASLLAASRILTVASRSRWAFSGATRPLSASRATARSSCSIDA